MRFACQCCGNCCRWRGFVRISDAECTAIAQFLNITEDEFRDQYMTLAPSRRELILKNTTDDACIFLTPDNKCQIYPVRPAQCASFPFDWDVPPENQRLCAGRQKQIEDSQKQVEFAHVLGHPQLPLDINRHPEDGILLNCRNICILLEYLKIPYIYYGCPGSILPGKLGTVVSTGKPTGNWSYRNAWHRLYTKRLNAAFAKNLRPETSRQIILSMYGAAQADISHLDAPVIEPMVGYNHCWADYRIFPSYSQQTAIYATCQQQTWNSRFNDAVIPHFLPETDYTPAPSQDDYLLFIGRDVPEKGLAIARKCAEISNLPIKVFHTGLTLPKKAELIARARAVMMPTLYLEPFGYVAAEALLCGTPVIATDWGAFPELIQHGKTGFLCRTQAEFLQAIHAAPTLDRHAIRQDALNRFSLTAVAPKFNAYFKYALTAFHDNGSNSFAAFRLQ